MDVDSYPVRVLYIMGAGHSGSTVLDIILGNHPGFVSVGELSNFIQRRGLNTKYCACGETATTCKFWSDVFLAWKRRIGADGIKAHQTLQNSFEHFRRWFYLQKEKGDTVQSSHFKAYAERTRALFEAIRSVSGKGLIIDSSKSPVRALALSKIPGIDLRLVHLVRDGRGMVWSLLKKGVKEKSTRSKRVYASSWLASLEWFLINASSGLVVRNTGSKAVRVRYEDLVENPQKVLTNIGQALEIGLAPVIDALLSGKQMKIGHNIAGNRVRMTGSIRLKPDYEWKQRLPKYDQRAFWLLAGVLAKTYGYNWD